MACLSHLEGNVFFNGPRGSININDGFGGGNVITGNVLFNFLRGITHIIATENERKNSLSFS